MKIGGVSSVSAYETLTTKVSVVTFPAASVAVQITFVLPVEKNDPEFGVHEIVVTLTLSVDSGIANDTFFPVGSVV